MPKKVRELEAALARAGFVRESGKGSHRKWTHAASGAYALISGQPGHDAHRYQERQVRDAIHHSQTHQP